MNRYTHIYAIVKIGLLAVIAVSAITATRQYGQSTRNQLRVSTIAAASQLRETELVEDIRDRLKGKTSTSEDLFINPENTKLCSVYVN